MTEPTTLFKYENSKKIYEELCKFCKDEGHKTYWKWFVALNEHPRRSGNREGVTNWICEIAKTMGLEYKMDAERNICVYVPATKGQEDKKSVCIQSHVDMVGTLAAGVEFDFATQPIQMEIVGEELRAKGTTLGGDDGSGVACGLAYMEMRDKFVHPAMEVLFTVDEEIGLLGACGLKKGELLTKNCKYLMNVDSEDWGEVTISSAGTAYREATLPLTFTKVEEGYSAIDVLIENFKGGHTGVEIHLQRANALKWIVEMIIHAKPLVRQNGNKFYIKDFQAGHAHNAIPSKATATIVVKNEIVDDVIKSMTEIHNALGVIYTPVEGKVPTLVIKKSEIAVGTEVITYTDSSNILQLLEKIPHGVLRFSPVIETLTETSQSLSIAHLEGKSFNIKVFARSSNNDYMASLTQAFVDMCKCYGLTCTVPVPDVGGWPADPDSHLLAVLKDTYKNMFGSEIKATAIHAGLENSMIMNIYDDLNLESISIGPSVYDVHTPQEHLIIETANKLFDLLKEVMTKL